MSRKFYSLDTKARQADLVIYGDVTSFPWLESDTSSYNLSRQLQALDVDDITVHINSYGGEVAEGLAIYNSLRNHKAKVTTECDGFACSIASVIFMAGDVRKMNEASLLMVHNASTCARGNAAELRKAAEDTEKVNDQSIKAYLSRVNIAEEELRALMDAETWLDAEEAVEMGFATEAVKAKDSENPTQSARETVRTALQKARQESPKGKEDGDEEPEKGTEKPDGEPENDQEEAEKEPKKGENEAENGEKDAETDEKEPEKAEKSAQMAFFRAIMGI